MLPAGFGCAFDVGWEGSGGNKVVGKAFADGRYVVGGKYTLT